MNTLFEAVLNGWWQGIVLTLLVWIVLRDMTRISAATKVAIWHVTLLIVLLLPALQRMPAPALRRTQVDAKPPSAVYAAGPVDTSFSAGAPLQVRAQSAETRPRPFIELSHQQGPAFLLTAAIVLALVQLFRLALGYYAVRRLKRKSSPASLPLPVPHVRAVDVLISERIGMPMAVGYRRPAILLPRVLIEQLTPQEMRYVLLHESAHLRRNDDWIALAERVIRAVFCFHPAVYWIGRQIEREREMACDDWVVAQAGETKPYASSLARLAELGSSGRVPVLATGSGRRKQIFARLETLLDRTRNRMPAISEPLVLTAGLVLLLAVLQGTRFNHLLGLSNFSNTWTESDGHRTVEMKMRGDIDFSPDDQDVETMSPGAMLIAERSEGWRHQRVEFEADEQGIIERRYFSGGMRRPFDTEGRRFAAALLPPLVREQGRNIPERLSRDIERKGVTEALNNIRTIRSNGVKRTYLAELFRQADLDSGQLRQALKIAGQMDSDGDKRQFLEGVQERYFDRDPDPQVFGFIDTIHSDGDRRKLLALALDRGAATETALARLSRSAGAMSSDNDKTEVLLQAAQRAKPRLPDAFFDAASTIHSDGDRERLLSMVLSAHGDDPQTVARVLQTAVSMSSDGDKAKILIASASGVRGNQDTLGQASQLLTNIHSDGDRRRALEALIEADGNSAGTLQEVLLQASKMNSDEDRSGVLVKAAGAFVEKAPVRRAFFSAVDAMHDSGGQSRVLLALLKRPDVTAETVHEVSLAALGISSNQDRAAVLKELESRR